MTNRTVIGTSPARVDGPAKVTGKAIYGPDLEVPNMLYAKILRSPLPHARILSVDTSRAEALVGVKAVITAADLLDLRWGRSIQDEELLARKKVTFVGQPVAAVAAETETIASEALELIEIEYEEKPAVFDPIDAMRPGAPTVHDDLGSYEVAGRSPGFGIQFKLVSGTNLVAHAKLRRGDVHEGFKEADFIFEDNFKSQGVHQAYMEPHGVVASVGPDGRIDVRSSGRLPHPGQAWLARLLGIPAEKIRVSSTFVGGMFGGKPSPRLEALCIVMSWKAGQPVKIVATRTEEFLSTGGRHPSIIRLKTGVRKNGTIVAKEVEAVWDTGAIEGGGVGVRGNIAALGPYRIPNIKADSYVTYTHKIGGASYRGVGYTQGLWACESQMDMIAKRLGIDPLEFRLKNAVRKGDIIHSGDEMPTDLADSLRKAAEEINYGIGPTKPNQGKSVVAILEHSTGGSRSDIKIQMNTGATVVVFSGAPEVGQGVQTVLAQMAAEALEVPLADVSVVTADTETTPYDSIGASKVTFHAGNALLLAVEDMKQQLLGLAAEVLHISPEGLEYQKGLVSGKEAPESRVALAELVEVHHSRHGTPFATEGTFTSRRSEVDTKTGQTKDLSPFWSFGAQAADVEVDPETGMVQVLRFVTVADVGYAIHPLNVRGQLEGGMMMALGGTLYEELQFEDGRMVNPSFYDYRIPTIMEMPGEVNTVILEHAHSEGPFGAKGVGEVGVCSVAPAIGNAVANAVGARVTQLPISPERVLMAIANRDQTGDAGFRES